jgi:hypothetical protein
MGYREKMQFALGQFYGICILLNFRGAEYGE